MKREEAIKVAIEMYGWLKTDREREALETLIPELSESNDERIRKYLIEELKAAKSVGELKFIIPQPTREECIAYLEKQKEQKPIEPSDEELQRHQDELYNFKVFAAKQAKEYHISYVHDFEWNNFCAEILSYFNEQKPAEWNEFDEDCLKRAIWYVENPAPSVVKDTNLALWLKLLRPHWKPSEQEKGALRTAIYILTNERNFPKAAAQLQNILDAFEGKESRKDWKPSEEQMEALKWLVEYVSPSEKYIVIVKNLYEQLKKFT